MGKLETRPISFRLSNEAVEALNKNAKDVNLSVGLYVQKLILEHLEDSNSYLEESLASIRRVEIKIASLEKDTIRQNDDISELRQMLEAQRRYLKNFCVVLLQGFQPLVMGQRLSHEEGSQWIEKAVSVLTKQD